MRRSMRWTVAGLVLAMLFCFPNILTAGQKKWGGKRTGPGRSGDDRRTEGTLKVGDKAPDFELVQLDRSGKKKGVKSKKDGDSGSKSKGDSKKEKKVKLSSFRGKKPVVLFFGSYT